MKLRHGPLLALLVAFGLSAVPAAAQDTITASLKHKSYQKWNWVLPSEQWSAVSGSIPVAHAGGQGFAVEMDGNKLKVDQTGNGRATFEIKGVGGFSRLAARGEDGKPVNYSVRFRAAGQGWQWATGGAMVGKLKGMPVVLFDQNNNGVYNDLGEDALIIGKGKGAAFLSEVINLKGKLYTIEVDPQGRSISAVPFTGEVGTLNVASGFKARGRLNSIVVSDSEGKYSFEMASAKKGLLVPVGDYAITAGQAKAGAETVMIRQGRMNPVAVTSGNKTDLEWGASVAIEFDYSLAAGNLTVEPSALRWYGAAGEEYYGWTPDAKSPKILILDAENGRLVGEGRFGGC